MAYGVEPTDPTSNVPAPLHVGIEGQSKAGGLILNTGGANIGLIIDKGLVGLGLRDPKQKLDVAGLVRATGLCIGSDCRTSWPLGGQANAYLKTCKFRAGLLNPNECTATCNAGDKATDGVTIETLAQRGSVDDYRQFYEFGPNDTQTGWRCRYKGGMIGDTEQTCYGVCLKQSKKSGLIYPRTCQVDANSNGACDVTCDSGDRAIASDAGATLSSIIQGDNVHCERIDKRTSGQPRDVCIATCQTP